MEIYHQLGHNSVWNLDCYKKDGIGDGAILAPRYMQRSTIEKMSSADKANHIFDPQFFIPGYSRGKLATYDFFPNEASDIFSTTDFVANNAGEVAEKCLAFQIEQGFRYLVIPSRYIDGMPANFVEQQSKIFVRPFLTALSKLQYSKPLMLQVLVNSLMVKNDDFFNELLNWLTSIEELAGIYLILNDQRITKQMTDPDLIFSYLKFIDVLSGAGLQVIVGYNNTEGVLVTLANPQAISIGSYETLRCFNPNKFGDPMDDAGGQPNPRIYIPRLFQWVEHAYLGSIKAGAPEVYSLIPKNKYQAIMFKPDFQWHFSKPAIYKHYFLEFEKQIKQMALLPVFARYKSLAAELEYARDRFRYMEDEGGVVLDRNSDGSHLPLWLTAINRFARYKGWK